MDQYGTQYQSIPQTGVLSKGLSGSTVKSGVNLSKITQMLTKRRQEKSPGTGSGVGTVPAKAGAGSLGSVPLKNSGGSIPNNTSDNTSARSAIGLLTSQVMPTAPKTTPLVSTPSVTTPPKTSPTTGSDVVKKLFDAKKGNDGGIKSEPLSMAGQEAWYSSGEGAAARAAFPEIGGMTALHDAWNKRKGGSFQSRKK